MKEALRIKISQEQIGCLDAAIAELEFMVDQQSGIYRALVARRKKEGLVSPGTTVTSSGIRWDLGEQIKLFQIVAETLRSGHEIKISPVIIGEGINKELANFRYEYFEGKRFPRCLFTPLQSNPGHLGIHRALAVTLFDSIDNDGDYIKPVSSSLGEYYDALMKSHRRVYLFPQPPIPEIEYYI